MENSLHEANPCKALRFPGPFFFSPFFGSKNALARNKLVNFLTLSIKG